MITVTMAALDVKCKRERVERREGGERRKEGRKKKVERGNDRKRRKAKDSTGGKKVGRNSLPTRHCV